MTSQITTEIFAVWYISISDSQVSNLTLKLDDTLINWIQLETFPDIDLDSEN